jgi:hypothetical protein
VRRCGGAFNRCPVRLGADQRLLHDSGRRRWRMGDAVEMADERWRAVALDGVERDRWDVSPEQKSTSTRSRGRHNPSRRTILRAAVGTGLFQEDCGLV